VSRNGLFTEDLTILDPVAGIPTDPSGGNGNLCSVLFELQSRSPSSQRVTVLSLRGDGQDDADQVSISISSGSCTTCKIDRIGSTFTVDTSGSIHDSLNELRCCPSTTSSFIINHDMAKCAEPHPGESNGSARQCMVN
jgi:hypothetical protein